MGNFFTWSMITAIVAFFVWLTQERKLGFDLFSKRLEAYERTREAIWKYCNDVYSAETNYNGISEFYDDIDRSLETMEMLFSKKIYLKAKDALHRCNEVYYDKIGEFHIGDKSPFDPSEKEIYIGSPEQRAILRKLVAKSRSEVARELRELRDCVVPYLKQRTATEWLCDCISYLRDKFRPTNTKDQDV